jgi:hypothetical protein
VVLTSGGETSAIYCCVPWRGISWRVARSTETSFAGDCPMLVKSLLLSVYLILGISMIKIRDPSVATLSAPGGFGDKVMVKTGLADWKRIPYASSLGSSCSDQWLLQGESDFLLLEVV